MTFALGLGGNTNTDAIDHASARCSRRSARC